MKQFFSKIAIATLISLVIINPVSASIYFKKFDANDYTYSRSSQEDLIEQIQAFAYLTLDQPEACTNRGEIETQEVFCTNIYEAARVRIALLMTINANIQDKAITKNNTIRRVIDKTKDAYVPDEFKLKPDYISNNEWENHLTTYSAYNRSLSAYGASTDVFYAMVGALKQCATGDNSRSAYRLKYLNAHLDTKTEPVDPPDKHPPVGCADLNRVLEQFTNRNRIKTILDNSPNAPWLNFTEAEKLNYQLTNQQKRDADSVEPAQESYQDIQSKCALTGVPALLVCPPMRFMGGIVQAGLDLIKKTFALNPKFTNRDSVGGQSLYRAWQEFRNLSNIALIILFCLMIIAYVSNRKIDNYNAKKLLPKLLVTVILINLSFFLLQVIVDISNIIASGIFKLSASYDFNVMNLVSAVLSGTLVAGTAIAVGVSIAALIPTIIGAAVSVMVILLILAFRDSAFIILTVLTPVAIISLVFPNAERFFQVWKKTIQLVLLIPITVSLLFTGGVLVSILMARTGGIIRIFSVIPLAMQFYLLPKILISSISNLPLVGEKIGSTIGGLSNTASQKYRESELHKWAIRNQQLKRSSDIRKGAGVYKYTNKVRDAANRGIDKLVPGYSLISQTKPFDSEVFKEISDLSSSLDPVSADLYFRLATAKPSEVKHIRDKLAEKDPTVQNRVNTMLQNSDPNQLLASMINRADDGEGSFEEVIIGIKTYLEQGGSDAYLTSIIQTMEANYRKEAKTSEAAQLKSMLKKIKKGEYKFGQVLSFTKEQKIELTKDYILDKSLPPKFKGFEVNPRNLNNEIENAAFVALLEEGKIDQNQFAKIQANTAQNQGAQDYLNSIKHLVK